MFNRTQRQLEELIHLEREQLRLLREIAHELRPHRLSTFSVVQFIGDFPMPNNVLVFNVGQSSTASPVTFLADGVTPSGATYSAATYTFSDPSATVVLNPDGVTATCTGVAASSAPVVGSVSFTATDTDGAVSTWTNSFTIQTNAVVPPPPTQLSQSSALQFSIPTP